MFVSSTYTDLLEERAEVMQALLELDCMPAGMELFPAANEEQWSWIKRVIDESDYYVVILAGRYGSVSERSGQSFTEMEYRYAIEIGKPTIAFLHEDPAGIEARRTESAPAGKKKLEQFRKLLEQRLCKHWNSPADLGAKVSRGITQLIKHNPAVGWLRADEVPEDQTKELLALRREVEELRERLVLAGVSTESPVQSLARGRDKYAVYYVVNVKEQKTGKTGRLYWTVTGEHRDKVPLTWDELFLIFAASALAPVPEHVLRSNLSSTVHAYAREVLDRKLEGKRWDYLRVYQDSFDTIKLQLRALGLMELGSDGRWKLTREGERYHIQLRAVHRKSS